MTTLAQDALDLLSDMGETLTLKKVSTGSYDPSTGSATETTTDYSVTGTFINYKQGHIDGSLIQRGDRKALIAAKGLTVDPAIDDKITGVDDSVRVVAVQKIREGGSTVAFFCQVRE